MDFEKCYYATIPIALFDIGDSNKSDNIIAQSGYYEPGMGSGIDFDDEMFDKIIENFNTKTGIATQKPLFYTHFRFGDNGKAAAWIERLSKRVDQETGKTQLVASFDWTDPGKLAVNKKEYRYFSIEVYKNYTKLLRDGSEIEFGPVLSAVALTNEPAISDLPGIFGKNNLAIQENPDKDNEKETEPMKKLFALLGVTNEEDALEKLKALQTEVKQAKENFSTLKEKKESEVESLKKDLEKEKADFSKYKEDSFKKEKETFLNSLFDAQKITKDAMDKAMKYSAEQFSVFRDVHTESVEEGAVITRPAGSGVDPKGKPNSFSQYFDGGKEEKTKKVSINDVLGE